MISTIFGYLYIILIRLILKCMGDLLTPSAITISIDLSDSSNLLKTQLCLYVTFNMFLFWVLIIVSYSLTIGIAPLSFSRHQLFGLVLHFLYPSPSPIDLTISCLNSYLFSQLHTYTLKFQIVGRAGLNKRKELIISHDYRMGVIIN